MAVTFADDNIKRLYINTVTKRVFITLYTTDISSKFEDIPYIRFRDLDHSSFPSSRGWTWKYFENWTPYLEALPP